MNTKLGHAARQINHKGKLMGIIQPVVLLMLIIFSTTTNAANPTVKMETNLGNITIELAPDQAPKTVENFLQYVNDGFYKNTIFHRVISNFMVQGGGFDLNFNKKETREPVANEANNGLKNEIGTIAMARTSDPHSATAQFFINVADNTFLNYSAPNPREYGYTVFGKVIDGMEIISKIASMPTGSGGPFPRDVPNEQIVIRNISILNAAPAH